MTGRNQRRIWVCSGVHPAEKKASGSGVVIPEFLPMLAPDELRLLDLPKQKVELPATSGVDHEIPFRQLHGFGHGTPPTFFALGCVVARFLPAT